jgi:hypothetical protein
MTTEAGKRLLAGSWVLGPGQPLMVHIIAAIEAEAEQGGRIDEADNCVAHTEKAVAAERARIAEAVRTEYQATREHFGCAPDEEVGLSLSAVLALVEP